MRQTWQNLSDTKFLILKTEAPTIPIMQLISDLTQPHCHVKASVFQTHCL